MKWLMFQNIFLVYNDIKNKEESNYEMIIISTINNIKHNKQTNIIESSRDMAENNPHLKQIMNIPYGLKNIQPRNTQVCTCSGFL